MPHFIKCCPMCFEQFYTERIVKVYCSKKCTNKARSVPVKLLQAMLDKANRATQVVETVPKVVKDFIAKHGGQVAVVSTGNGNVEMMDKGVLEHMNLLGLSKQEQQDILDSAIKLKQERRQKELEKEFAEDNDKFIDTDDPLKGGSDGFK